MGLALPLEYGRAVYAVGEVSRIEVAVRGRGLKSGVVSARCSREDVRLIEDVIAFDFGSCGEVVVPIEFVLEASYKGFAWITVLAEAEGMTQAVTAGVGCVLEEST